MFIQKINLPYIITIYDLCQNMYNYTQIIHILYILGFLQLYTKDFYKTDLSVHPI